MESFYYHSTMKTETLQKWLLNTVSGLVNNPQSIQIENKEDEMGLFFTIKVDKEDCGKIIGKSGKTADALRTLLRSAASLYDLRASMKIDAGTQFEPVER